MSHLKVEEEDNSYATCSAASFGLREGLHERVTVWRLDHMCGPFLARSVTEQRSEGILRTHKEETQGQRLEGRCLPSSLSDLPILPIGATLSLINYKCVRLYTKAKQHFS